MEHGKYKECLKSLFTNENMIEGPNKENDFRGRASMNEKRRSEMREERRKMDRVQCFGTGFTDQVFFSVSKRDLWV